MYAFIGECKNLGFSFAQNKETLEGFKQRNEQALTYIFKIPLWLLI